MRCPHFPLLHASRRKLLPLVGLAAFLFQSSSCIAETPVTAWVQRYGGLVNSDDWASKVVADADGNVLVAGFVDEQITGRDMLLVKYSGSGAPLWTNRFNGPDNGDDEPAALVVDGNGNAYLTGYSAGIGSSVHEFATLAFSSAGIPLWTNRYKGPANSDNNPVALALDDAGNVFVTGFSGNTNARADFATIKYSSGGVALWTNRYDGPAGDDDFATALAVDTNGNVIVTGRSIGNSSSWDYATIAYSSSGAGMWTNRYNASGNSYDRPNAIAVSSNGTVVVTGYSVGVGSSYDFATIAYSNLGIGLWTNRYNGSGNGYDTAVATAVDASGNVFVAGTSDGAHGAYTNADYAIIKYSAAGFTLWVNRFNGPANSSENAAGFVLDEDGNVLVTGYSDGGGSFFDYATIKYSNSGAVLWTNYFRGPASATDQANAMAVDAAGNVSVTGVSYGSGVSRDWVTVSYAGSGSVRWTNYFGGRANSYDEAIAVAVDGSGNAFVTGDSATIKYSGSGVALWTNYAGMRPTAMVCDQGGNVFLTGYASGPTGNDYLTVAYSGAGEVMWINRYDGPASSDDRTSSVAVDNKGNVLVTGYSRGAGTGYDYATLAYSGTGIPLWTNRYNGLGNGADYAIAIVADIAGNVFVTGYSPGTNSYDDYITIAYSSTGTPLWTNSYDGPANSYDQAKAVIVDTVGHVFVTGKSIGIASYYDYATVAYSNSGTALWTNRYGYSGPWNNEDGATALAVDHDGNLIVTGSSPHGTYYSYDEYVYATIKYSGSGVPLWTNRSELGNASAVAADSDGNVFVSGYGPIYYYDFITVKYSAAGLSLWTNRYNGPANGYDKLGAHGIAISPEGAVFITGTSDGNYSPQETPDFATIKLVSLPEITSQPKDRTNGTGAVVTFAVTATGSAPLQYQWQRYGTNLINADGVSGSNSKSLAFGNVQAGHAGNYTVIVSNAFGSTTSIVATLTVIAPSSIWLSSSKATNGVFCIGFTNIPGATFTVFATTNVVWPLNAWSNLGPAVETPPASGQFQFIDPQASNYPHQFYRVRSP